MGAVLHHYVRGMCRLFQLQQIGRMHPLHFIVYIAITTRAYWSRIQLNVWTTSR